MSNLMNKPVLVLNASYEPIHYASARRAITLIVKGAAVMEKDRDIFVHLELKLPSVIRLRDYRRIPQRQQTLTRKHIYIRDGYMCQYCAKLLAAIDMTLDHVVPESRGGRSTWENLVACCRDCNRKKNDRTPEEWGIPLLKQPRRMTVSTSRSLMRLMGMEEKAWHEYLYVN